jgi:hypothetical protein
MKVAPDGSVLRGSGLGLLASGSPDVWLPGLDQLFPVLPSRPVAPGAVWNFQSIERFAYGFGSLSYSGHESFEAYANLFGTAAPGDRGHGARALDHLH